MRFIHTTDAIWTCDLVETLGRRGHLRCAVIVLTPYARIFHEFQRYRPRPEREEAAALFIRETYLREVWYRRPRVLESPSETLVERLKTLELRPSCRPCSESARLTAARGDFSRRHAPRRV